MRSGLGSGGNNSGSQNKSKIVPSGVTKLATFPCATKSFKQKWIQAKTNEKYLQLLAKHQQMYEQKQLRSRTQG